MIRAQQEHYDAADRLREKLKAEAGGCFAPKGSTCDESHCECAQIAFDHVIDGECAALHSSLERPPIQPITEPARDATRVPRPIDDWAEEDGDVLWWCWQDGEWLGEPPYVGSPLDLGHTVECHTHAQNGDAPAARFMVGGWPGYHTHWTPLPDQPYAPDQST